ncbi:PREDICTED: pollen-specific leucine-rich repeat extensin-like protein 1 [Amphimedon queenslandica]|uniref:Rho-GAP domain-containing protein n=2 Tax=Amphimedon queenslandica TaxID=400682 RepID=A0A1X7VJM8_AMPQE|nr:PREDICTED: pollen-specific leucine-rich repeat extensin-like protein 1 [Amphimedon queenslandica]XP_019848869.1 PREDICTED: pollen-specific leucine-rich repeat extensin-like protein 1 [Amphimedon queenslandica]|eukprot:XP_011410242.1 PREDICTED: pollen-specific leucine-rich repeat extensin-like protein 1 [Amphimedon queenslandica]
MDKTDRPPQVATRGGQRLPDHKGGPSSSKPIPSKPARPPKPRSVSLSSEIDIGQYTSSIESPAAKDTNIPSRPPKPPKPVRSMSFSAGVGDTMGYGSSSVIGSKSRSASDSTDPLSGQRRYSGAYIAKKMRRSNSVKETVLQYESKRLSTSTGQLTRSSSMGERMFVDIETINKISPQSPLNSPTTDIPVFDAFSPTTDEDEAMSITPPSNTNIPVITDPLYSISEKTSSSPANSPSIPQKDIHVATQKSRAPPPPPTDQVLSSPSPPLVKDRPAPPKRPPPPLSRPPRPFPPPPSSSPPRISEAKLARKRPPPTPPLIIDSRHSPQHTPHSMRSLKTNEGTPPESSKAPPKRPPRPSVSPVQSKVSSENSPVTSPEPVQPDNTEKTSQVSADETNSKSESLGTLPEDESIGDTSVASPSSSPCPSPGQGRKMLGKVKESFRNLRRNRTVHHSSRGDASRSPSNWRRAITVRGHRPNPTTYNSERYPETLSTGIVDPLLVQCISYLNKEDILKEPGLFRIPGDLSIIKQLRRQFVAGEFVDLSEIHDPNVITGLLKIYYREKPYPLISNRDHLARVVQSSRNHDVQSFKEAVDDFDDITLASLRMLAELFKKIAENSEDNHMTSGILATSCGPSFFPNTTPSNANGLIKFVTDHCDQIFSV